MTEIAEREYHEPDEEAVVDELAEADEGLQVSRKSRVRDGLKKVHRTVTAIEPWGILIAIVAAIFAFLEFRTDRSLREATLLVMVVERTEAARNADAENSTEFPQANAGQVRVLEEAVGAGVSLRNTDLGQLNLSEAMLEGADLRSALLHCSVLIDANLARANLRDANPQNTNFHGANLYRTDFTRASVGGSVFYRGTLVRADFSDAHLRDTEFSNVPLTGTDFTDARFGNTRFEDVDLRNAKGLTQNQLDDACGESVQLRHGLSIQPCAREAAPYDERCDLRRLRALRCLDERP